MSNEVGNILYRNTVKYIQEMCKKQGKLETKQLADYIVEKTPITSIYNVTDAVQKMYNSVDEKGSLEDTMQRLGIPYTPETSFSYDKEDYKYCDTISIKYPMFQDNVFIYFKYEEETEYFKEEDHYFLLLLHRLDDDRVISFIGHGTQNSTDLMDSCPIKIGLQGCEVNLIHIVETVSAFAHSRYDRIWSEEKIDNYTRKGMESRLLDISVIFKLFQDISDQSKREFRCYIDEEEKGKSTYFRKMTGDRNTVKAPDKPIILVLRDDEDIEHKVQKYRNPRGKIHYAFSWIVRGHYRKLHDPESVGKDRNGERVVQGMTWVETYLKGDENLPLLKRETIVIDKRKNKCTMAV